MKEVRAAVIGVGRMGRNHARVYSELSGVSLVGVADTNETEGRDVAVKFGATYFADYKQMLSELKPDVCSVVVPTTLHLQVAGCALEHCQVVLVEKPIALNEDEGKRLIEIAGKLHKKLTVGHIERYNPAVRATMGVIEQGEIGTPLQILFRREGSSPPRVVDMNIIEDIGIHDIDLAYYFLRKKPVRVTAEGGCWKRPDIDYASIMLGYNGVLGRPSIVDIKLSWTSESKIRKIDIIGSDGYLSADLIGKAKPGETVPTPRVIVSDRAMVHRSYDSYEDYQRMVSDQIFRELPIVRAEPLRSELEEVVKEAREEPADLVKPEEALMALRIAKAAVADIHLKNDRI